MRKPQLSVKIEHYLRFENKANENKVLSWCEALRCMQKQIRIMKKLFSILSNLQTHYHVKVDFRKLDQHTGGKWLIHGTKHRKDNRLQSLRYIIVAKMVQSQNINRR